MPIFDAKALARWTGGRWRPAAPSFISGVSIDSRTLSPGNVFVAIGGARFDGHAFVRQAFEKGAAGAIVCGHRGLSPGEKSPLLCVSDTAKALRDMAGAYRRQIGLSVMAVTGSVGKTTVKEMVADVLASKLETARTRGNWNNDIGVPLSLLALAPSTRVGVFEVGTNHPGELAPLCRLLSPEWGLVTTIAPVHLEYFKSEEGVVEEKSSLLKSLPVGGAAILRSDDPWYNRLRASAPGRVITLALEGEADYRGIPPREWQGEAQVMERMSGERFRFKMPLPGRHHLVNALYAVAAGRAYGLTWEEIRRPLEGYQSQPMRWECRLLNGITVVNDAYNANPVSMAAALQTFADMPVRGRKWLVLAGMLELGSEEVSAHEAVGRIVAQGAWDGVMGVGALGSLMASTAEKAGMKPARIFHCRDHAEAARRLSRETASGDAVLFKGSRGQHLEQVLALWKQIGITKERT